MNDIFLQRVCTGVMLVLQLAAVAIADGETCHRSIDNQTVVPFSQCPFGCCQCDRCHPDKPGYDGEIWSHCGNEHWCSASARGFWWIIATACGSVLGLVVICVVIDWLGKPGADQTPQQVCKDGIRKKHLCAACCRVHPCRCRTHTSHHHTTHTQECAPVLIQEEAKAQQEM